MDDLDRYDEEGEDDPEYPRLSASDRVRKVLTGLLSGLLGLVLILAFFAAAAALAEYLGGPTQ